MLRVSREIEVLVETPVAVLVLTVAALHPPEGLRALTAVCRNAVEIVIGRVIAGVDLAGSDDAKP
tara:strand:- start:209 stop:403 length:195 start_codon:yes stop_codon:yes gene_type:complete